MKRKTICICMFSLIIVAIIVYLLTSEMRIADKAKKFIAGGDFNSAILLLESQKENEEMQKLLEEAYYQKAKTFVENGAYTEASEILIEHLDYEQASELYKYVQYCIGLQYYQEGEYEKALNCLYSVQEYGDCKNKILEIKYMYAKLLLQNEEYVAAYYVLEGIQEYEDSNKILSETVNQQKEKFYQEAVKKFDEEEYVQALELFQIVGEYGDSKDYIEKINLYQNVQGTWEMKTSLGSTSIMTINKFTLTHTFMGGDVNEQSTYDLYFEKYGNKWSLTYKKTYFGLNFQEWYCLSNDKLLRYQEEEQKLSSDDIVFSYVKVSEDTNVASLKEPQIGMTADEVKRSTWAAPSDVNTTTTAMHTYEQWCYSNYKYIYFEDGVVVSIQE